MVFATQKFHEFVYGMKVLIATDHKPLMILKDKPICELTPRLQRLMLKLRKYDMEYQYTSGTKLVIADTLLQAYQENTEDSSLDEEIAVHVHLVRTYIPISSDMWCKIAVETEKDSVLNRVKRCILSGHGW